MDYKVKILIPLILTITILFCSTKKYETIYYTNGRIKSKIELKNGTRNGKMLSYYKNGMLKGEAFFNKGKLEGLAKGYDSLSGKQLTEYSYSNNVKEGIFREFYLNGSIRLVGYYKKGKLDSLGYEYYKDGKVHKIYFYNDSKLIYFKALRANGSYYGSFLPIKIKELKPNPSGDSIAYKLSLEFSIYDSVRIGAIIGHLDSKNQLIDTLRIIGSSNMETIYAIPIKDRGKEFSGELYEVKMPENIIMGSYWFKYPSVDSVKVTY